MNQPLEIVIAMTPPKRRGRPRRVPAARSEKRIEILLTEAELLDLWEVAKENDRSVSGVLRDAVNEYVADYRERSVFPR